MNVPLPSRLWMGVLRLFGRMAPGSRPSLPGLEGVQLEVPTPPAAALGILADHYLPVLCHDLASWSRRYSPEAVAAVLPLLELSPRREAVRMLELVLEVYGTRAFLPLPAVWVGGLLPLDRVLAGTASPEVVELATTLAVDGFPGTLGELLELSTAAAGFPSP